MQILILSQFWLQILILKQLSNHKSESKNNNNVNFELIFIKNHKSESKNHEDFNFESIIKNHNFESKNYELLILNKLSKITNLNQKIIKILIPSQFLSKINNFYKNHAATQRDAARRSATPTEDFATQRDGDWRFRDAARRRLKISRRSATPRNFMIVYVFLNVFLIQICGFFLIKIKSKLICSLFFDLDLWFYKNWFKINIFIFFGSNLWSLIKIESKLIFSWFVDSDLWLLIKIYSKLIFSLFFDSNLWFMIKIVSKLTFAFRIYSKLNKILILINFRLRFMIFDKNCLKI